MNSDDRIIIALDVPNAVLGLNIVKNIIQLHKGTIAASNRLNTKGAQVEVLLPKLS